MDKTYRTKSGRVLTDADIEALAKEAEEGYDVSATLARRGTITPEQRSDFADAHAEGLHDDLPREGCPECEAGGDRP